MGEHYREEDLCVYYGHEPGHTHFHDPVRLFYRGMERPAGQLRRAVDRLRRHGEPDDLPGQGFDLAREAADGGHGRNGHHLICLRRERAAAAEDGQQRRYRLLLQRESADRARQGQRYVAVLL